MGLCSRRALRAASLACLASILAAGGCSSSDPAPEAAPPPPASPLAVTVAPPPAGACERFESRECSCPFGSGSQSCKADGSGWEACMCPVKEAKLASGAIPFDLDGKSFTSDGRTLLAPVGSIAPRPGDVLVSMHGKGFLGRVTKVMVEGSQQRIFTTEAKLKDAFERLKIHISGPVNLAGALPKPVRDKVVEPKIGLSGEYGFFSWSVSGELGVDFHIDPGTNVSLNPTLDADIDIGFFDLDYFLLKAGLDVGIALNTTAKLTAQGSAAGEIELTKAIATALGYPEAAPIRVNIGGGLVVEITVPLGCELTVGGSATFSSTANLNAHFVGGVEYDGDKWRTIKEQSVSREAKLTSYDWSASAGIECYVRPQIDLKILDIAGPYVNAGPYIETTVNIGRHDTAELSAGLKGAIGGKVEVLDITFWEHEWPLFDLNWPIWSTEWSICGDGWQQLDEECDIGPFYTLHSQFPKPNPSPCTDKCKCAKGFVRYIDPSPNASDTGTWGAKGNYCVPSCGNGKVDEGEACDEGAGKNGSCGHCSQDCTRKLGVCGDGVIDKACGEVCDDGNTNDCDGCNSACSFNDKLCGDGIVSWNCGEQCDDGNQDDNDACRNDCTMDGGCGDGHVGPGEQCDDGNKNDCDGCHNDCTTNANLCGDKHTCGGEQCDGGPGGSWTCNPDCTIGKCGDGVVNKAAGEQCDGAGWSKDCDIDCTISECGDGTVNKAAGEECDSVGQDTYSCDSDCTLRACGDGHVNAAYEACDDGDQDDCTPGCNSSCTGPGIKPVCGDGVAQCGEACDDGAQNGQCGKCNTSCTGVFGACGDGALDASCGEVCDDGNIASGDGCRADCKGTEKCGDYLVDVGEVCDDGNTASCAGNCNETCAALYADVCGDKAVSGCEVCEDTDPTNKSIDQGCSAAAPNCAGCKACSSDVCGDGVIGPSEVCEPKGVCQDASEKPCTSNDLSQCLPGTTACAFYHLEGACNESCTRIQKCGDKLIDGSETCDDGNTADSDGCSSSCQLE